MKIGRHSIIPTESNITAPVIIGNFCSFAPHIQMHNLVQHACIPHPELVATYSHKHYPYCERSEKPIIIGNDVWIGQGVIILGPVTIGDGAIIGAYSVVAKDIPAYAVAVGNPVQIKRYRFHRKIIKQLLQIKWWDWSDEKIKEYQSNLLDIEKFVKTHALAKKHK